MTSAPRLLDQLATLTAIKDVELMEFSLLKTLKGFLRARSLSLIHLNSRGQPSKELVYGDEKIVVRHDNIVLEPEVRQADEVLTSSDAPYYSTQTDKGLLLVFTLIMTRIRRNYLRIIVSEDLSKVDSHMLAGILQIYRNFVGMIQHAQTDQLTGLANRKTFDDCVEKVHDLIPAETEPIAGERRENKPLSYWLVMIDIDHFKSVNDRFGHLYGDEVLVILSQMMQAAFRESDWIFRFGGEEFVLIIRCADHRACLSTLNRFRLQVEQRRIPQVGHITISMGAARMGRDAFAATMIDQADQALYYSKRNGRNQVAFFEDLVTQGLVVVNPIKTDEISFF